MMTSLMTKSSPSTNS